MHTDTAHAHSRGDVMACHDITASSGGVEEAPKTFNIANGEVRREQGTRQGGDGAHLGAKNAKWGSHEALTPPLRDSRGSYTYQSTLGDVFLNDRGSEDGQGRR